VLGSFFRLVLVKQHNDALLHLASGVVIDDYV